MSMESISTWRMRLPLYVFFIANLVSFVGDRLTLLAVPWFVLQTTGSVTKTGITAFFSTLPNVLSAFFCGPLVERLGFKRTSVLGDCASGLCVLLIPLLYHTLGLAFWQLLVLTFLGGLLKAPGETARASLLPDLGNAARLAPERMNSLGDGMMRVAGLLGVPLAALLIVLIGASNLLWLDAASFFCSALLIGLSVPATLVSSSSQKLREDELTQEAKPANLLAGLRFIGSNGLFLAILMTATLTNTLDGGLASVGLPVYAQQIWRSVLPIGLLSGIFGGCAFVSTIVFGLFGQRLPRRWLIALGFLLIGLRFWALAFRLPLGLLVGVYALCGLAVGPINPIATTIEQEVTPVALRARVFGASAALSLGMTPLGGLFCGLLISWVGLIPALFVMAVCYLLATSNMLVNPALRQLSMKKA